MYSTACGPAWQSSGHVRITSDTGVPAIYQFFVVTAWFEANGTGMRDRTRIEKHSVSSRAEKMRDREISENLSMKRVCNNANASSGNLRLIRKRIYGTDQF